MNYFSKNKSFVKENFFTMDSSPIVSLLNSEKTSAQLKNESTKPKSDSINRVWTKEHFGELNGLGQRKSYLKANLSLDLKPLKTSWANTNNYEGDINADEEVEDEEENEFKRETQETSPTPTTPDKEIVSSPSHHARRPMNAFLIFCKKHRPIVRQKFPHLENRGVTRILGEWWALLETTEKSCYTNLAKEYKDAFFSANPDFKWYKLPAPPLRTLNTRPINVYKIASPLASPTVPIVNSAEFTPGKLADETQLGNLTSLMQTNCSTAKTLDSSNTYTSETVDSNSFLNNNNNIENNSEKHKQLLITPVTESIITSFPPKPIKKRKFYEFSEGDNNNVARNIFNVESQGGNNGDVDHNENSVIEGFPEYDSNNFHIGDPENMTQQELMNKVVDSMFSDKDIGDEEYKDEAKETRKSGRSCKGRRYAEFMMEGKLLGTKQIKRFTQNKVDINNKFDNALSNKIEHMVHNKTEPTTPKLDLNETIKRLAERTNTKLEDISDVPDSLIGNKTLKRKRTESENSDDSILKLQSDFNLHLRIAELPSLSYEAFMQRKKDSKKRKSIRSKSESSLLKAKVTKLPKTENDCLVGSKKRKNKNNIIRLEPIDSYPNNLSSDLFGLATLAEVAANTQKIN